MKNNQQSGFGVIGVVLLIIVAGVIGFAGWRVLSKNDDSQENKSADTSQQESSNTKQEEPDIILQNLGLASLDSIDINNYAVREFTSQGLKGFYIFGDKLSGGRTNPNFEYSSVKTGTKVVSAIDGIVGFIKEQPDTKDYEIFIQPKEGSKWTIGYDHITGSTLKKGDTVKAGDPIGEPAIQNNGLLRFEIQINKDDGGSTTHYCPTSLLDSSVKDTQLIELTNMQNKWESVTGLELYDVATQNPVGCSVTTLTPQQAEGR